MKPHAAIKRPNTFADNARARRIALVLSGLRAGGSEHVVTFIANQLAERGHEVEIVNFESGSDAPYYPADPSVNIVYLSRPVKRLAKLNAMYRIATRIIALRRHFRQSRPDLVISFLTRVNVQTVLATRGFGTPVIVSERNNPIQQDPGWAWRTLRRRTYPMATGLVTMTRGAMECFAKDRPRRSWVIPNMAEFDNSARQVRTGSPRVLTAVGRLTHQKGFDLLLRAFARVAADHPDWILRIWGEGAARPQLEALRKTLDLDGRVDLPGITESPGAWVETADAFVLSSRFEGWGLVLGEAMAAGLPSVSFECDFGPKDMITHEVDGLLVPSEDVGELARQLSRLMGDDRLRASLGSKARETSRRFAPERIGRRWTDLIENLLIETAAQKGAQDHD